ncbi:MAG: ISAs1 family transposase, partial [Myxococcales bacterium]|nr:ISAs1 family transposase [Myxococcales bacterium]
KATNQYCPLSHDWEASGETNDPQFLQTSHTSTGKTSSEIAYYIGSEKTLQAKEAARIIRRHWGIENELHWVLDMAFREDEARHRAKNTAQPQPPSATSL